MKRVVAIGSAIVDVIAKSPSFKVVRSDMVSGGVAMCEVYGGKMEADEMVLMPGGAGTNVAVGLARMGFVTSAVVRTGNDLMGEVVLNALKAEGVDTSMVQIDVGGRTGISVVLVALDGGRSIVTYRGVSREIRSSEIDWDRLKLADWIQVSSLGGNMDLLEDIVAFAVNNKIRVGVNPGKGELLELDRLKRSIRQVELLIVNRMEAVSLLRHDCEDDGELVSKLMKIGPRICVVTNGKEGAILGTEGKLIKMKAFKVKSVDDTGAGDAFCSGLVAGILDNLDWEAALKLGLANGASEVTEMGVKNGLLRRREAKKWLSRRLLTVEEEVADMVK